MRRRKQIPWRFHLISAGRWVFGRRCSPPTRDLGPMPNRVANGIAAPIWPRHSRIAANAIRHGTLHSRSTIARNSVVPSPPDGMHTISAAIDKRASALGTTMTCEPTFWLVKRKDTGPPPGRWVRRSMRASAGWRLMIYRHLSLTYEACRRLLKRALPRRLLKQHLPHIE